MNYISMTFIFLLLWGYVDCTLNTPEIMSVAADNNSMTITWTWSGDMKNINFTIQQAHEISTNDIIVTATDVKTVNANEYQYISKSLYPGEYTYKLLASNNTDGETSGYSSSKVDTINGQKPNIAKVTVQKFVLIINWVLLNPHPQKGLLLSVTPANTGSITISSQTISSSQTSYTTKLLTPGEQYSVTLVATYTTKHSVTSDAMNKVITPSVPKLLPATNITTSHFTLNWEKGDGVVDEYKVIINNQAKVTKNKRLILGPYTAGDLYKANVRASSFGTLSAPDMLEVRLYPNPPTITSAKIIDRRKCDVQWSTSGVVSEFVISFKSDNGDMISQSINRASQTRANIELLPAQRYKLTIVSKSDNLESSPAEYPTKLITEPSKPAITRLSSTIPKQIDITWNLQHSIGDGTIEVYDTFPTKLFEKSSPDIISSGTINNVTAGKKYTLELRASRFNKISISDKKKIVVRPFAPVITDFTDSGLLVKVNWKLAKEMKSSYSLVVFTTRNPMTIKNIDNIDKDITFVKFAIDATYRGEKCFVKMDSVSFTARSKKDTYKDSIVIVPNIPSVSISDIKTDQFDVTPSIIFGRADTFVVTVSLDDKLVTQRNITRISTISSSLIPGNQYEVSAYSVSYDKKSPPSDDTTISLYPSIPTFSLNGLAGSLRVTINEGRGKVESFIIFWKNSDTSTFFRRNVPISNNKQYDVDNLESGTYVVKVSSVSHGKSTTTLTKTVDVTAAKVKLAVNVSSDNIATLGLRWNDTGLTHFVIRLLEGQNCRKYIVIYDQTKTKPKQLSSQNCDESVNISQILSNMALQYRIGQLAPDTQYTIEVIQHAAQVSDAVSHSFSSFVVVPGSVNEITIIEEETRLKICWAKPMPRPGPTNYTLSAVDIENGSNTVGHVKQEIIYGYNNNCGFVSDLEEYWWYNVNVMAHTAKGAGPKSFKDVRTLPTNPGKIRSLDIRAIDGVYVKIKVEWKPPAKRDENSEINRFVINYKQVKPTVMKAEKTIKFISDYPDLKSVYSVDVAVRPEAMYQFKVHAESAQNKSGQATYENVTTDPGPPPAPKVPVTKMSNKQVDSSSTSFFVILDVSFFHNAQNGAITDRGLIVSKENHRSSRKRRSHSVDHFSKFENWHYAKDNDFKPYRVTPSGWNIGSNGEYIVGKDTKCEEKSSIAGFCNGPVASGTVYFMKAFSCTGGGCTETSYVKIAETSADNQALIIGLAVGLTLAVLIIITLILLGLIWYRRGRSHGTTTKVKKESLTGIEMVEQPQEPNHPKNKPIPIDDFANQVTLMHNDSDLIFSTDYRCIQEMSPRLNTLVARASGNTGKNRYTDILPFDATRVKLLPLITDDEEGGGDYINANFMTGESGRKEYIAAQGPLPATIDDFIRLVWEHNVSVIVMLTKCEEKGVRKCENYWPMEEHVPALYGDITVELMATSTLNTYTLREMEFSMDDKVQRVKQFHYLNMMDHDTTAVDSFIDFDGEVRSHVRPDNKGPILVHCSAGVGRTGTFIAVDRLRRQILEDSSPNLDVYGLVLGLRHERTRMVQTESQYIFIHDCVVVMLERKLREKDDLYGNQAYLNVGFKPDEENVEPLYENSSMLKTEL